MIPNKSSSGHGEKSRVLTWDDFDSKPGLGWARATIFGVLVLLWAALGAAFVAHISQEKPLPPRRNAIRIEIVLMAEECEWEGRKTLIDGLKCVREKIDERLKELEEAK